MNCVLYQILYWVLYQVLYCFLYNIIIWVLHFIMLCVLYCILYCVLFCILIGSHMFSENSTALGWPSFLISYSAGMLYVCFLFVFQTLTNVKQFQGSVLEESVSIPWVPTRVNASKVNGKTLRLISAKVGVQFFLSSQLVCKLIYVPD